MCDEVEGERGAGEVVVSVSSRVRTGVCCSLYLVGQCCGWKGNSFSQACKWFLHTAHYYQGSPELVGAFFKEKSQPPLLFPSGVCVAGAEGGQSRTPVAALQ